MRWSSSVRVVVLLAALLVACGATSTTTTAADIPPETTTSGSSPSAPPSSTPVGGNELGARELFPDLGADHLSDEEASAIIAGTLAQPEYNSVPPTSGQHASYWADCGIYLQVIPDIVQVHSLEHGAVLIQYNPEIDPADISALRLYAHDKADHVIVAPNPAVGAYIVLTAWQVRMELTTLNIAAMDAFWLDYANEGPERVPCPVEIDEASA